MEVGSNFMAENSKEFISDSIFTKQNIMAVVSGFMEEREGVKYGVDLSRYTQRMTRMIE